MSPSPTPATLRTDVIALLRQMSAKMASPLGGILRGLLAEMARDAELAGLIREQIHTAGPADDPDHPGTRRRAR